MRSPDDDRDPALATFFEMLRRHGDVIRTRSLQLIGAGGTHLVYVDPDRPRHWVYRIARERCADAPAHSGENPLAGYFPSGWLPDSRIVIAPVTMPDGQTRADAAIGIQRYEAAFFDDRRIALQAEYPEIILQSETRDVQAYHAMNRLLDGTWTLDVADAYLSIHPAISRIAELARGDASFRRALAFFLDGARRYVADTGCILDLAGRDNVLFLRRPSGWIARVGDIVKHDGLEPARRLPDRLDDPDALTVRQIAELLNGLAFVRLLNATSHLIGDRPAMSLALGDAALEKLRQSFVNGFWKRRLVPHRQHLVRPD